MQGSTMITETLASYSALMVMEKLYGPDAVGRILRFDMDGYLDERSNDVLGERPLVRVEDQPYLAYNKGAIVMYHLREVVGEAAVNRALRRLLRDHAFKGPPYPTSREFMAAIRAETPPAHQQLLTRLFEEVGPPDLVTRPSAPASAPPDGGASSSGRSTRR
jgi:aminopeptidase N